MGLDTMASPPSPQPPMRRGRPPAPAQKKLTLNVPDRTHDKMLQMADERRLPVTQLLRNAFTTYLALTEILKNHPNARITLDGTPDGPMLALSTIAPTLALDAWS